MCNDFASMASDQQTPSGRAEELAERVLAADVVALAELFEIDRPRLLRVVAARLDPRLRGRLDPGDVLQDAFLDLTKKLPDFAQGQEQAGDRSGMTPFVWMRLVVAERIIIAHRRNLLAEARDARREISRIPMADAASSVMLVNHIVARASSMGARVIREETSAALREAIDTMDPADREIITLRALEGLSNTEAAQVLGISDNGASSRYVRAMTRLKRAVAAIPGFVD